MPGGWATRSIVYLDQRHFQSRGGADGLLEYSKEIVRRYERSKLKIESFRFCMEIIESDCFSLVNELIVDAMKLGACDLNVEIMQGTTEFDLSHEVLRSENLARLCVSGCRIDLEATGGEVVFSKLKSLSLRGVCMVGFFTFDIASNCPLIEELVLSKCTAVRISNGNTVETIRFVLGPLNDYDYEKQSSGLIVDAPIHPYDNLKRLYLERIAIDGYLFRDMSRSFPCLKDLTLNECRGFLGILISCPSLEFLSIAHTDVFAAKFDVPCLRKFTFSGRILHELLSFEAASRDLESDISVAHLHGYINSFKLDVLKKILRNLSLSKVISLSLSFGIVIVRSFGHVEPAPCLPIPEVENLMLSMRRPTSACSSLLRAVFCTCRPKFITQDWLPQLCIGREEKSDMLKLLCKTLIDKESESCCIPSRHMSDMYGLEKVDVEVFEDGLAEWQPLPWKALVDDSESPKKKQKIRFKLVWR